LPFVGLRKIAIIIDGSSVEASWQDFVLELRDIVDFTIDNLFVLDVHGFS
jgi:hypothetical protein